MGVRRGVWVGVILVLILLAAIYLYAFSSQRGNASSSQGSSSQLTSSTQSSSSQLGVVVERSVFREDGGGTGTTLSASCASTPALSYVMFANNGDSSTSVVGVTLEFGSGSYNAALSGCNIGARGSPTATLYLNFDTSGSNLAFGAAGDPLVISITLANGEQISGTSTFS